MNKSPINFLNHEINISNKNNNDKVLAIAKALSTNERLEILNLLQKNSMTVSEISKYFYMSASTATFHLKLLKNAGLINIEMLPSKKGKIQICQINMKSILLYLSTNKPNENKTVIYNMPVGHYTDAKLDFISGFCTKEKQYMFDNGNYFIPERMSAELIWCKSGFVSYSFSNTMPSKKINEIDFSLELCSETLGYYNNWKSDITFSLNGIELLTYTSPGDFGGERYGNLNPDWWKTDNSTQYGLLVQIKITYSLTINLLFQKRK